LLFLILIFLFTCFARVCIWIASQPQLEFLVVDVFARRIQKSDVHGPVFDEGVVVFGLVVLVQH